MSNKKILAVIIAAFFFLLAVLGMRIKGLSDELRSVKRAGIDIAKQGGELAARIEQAGKKIAEQQSLIEDKDELYANLAAELHKVQQRNKELEEEMERSKSGRIDKKRKGD